MLWECHKEVYANNLVDAVTAHTQFFSLQYFKYVWCDINTVYGHVILKPRTVSLMDCWPSESDKEEVQRLKSGSPSWSIITEHFKQGT